MSTEHEGDGRPSGAGQTDETAPADRTPQAAPHDPPPPGARADTDAPAEASSSAPEDSAPPQPGAPPAAKPTTQLRRITPGEPPPAANGPSLEKQGDQSPPPPAAPPTAGPPPGPPAAAPGGHGAGTPDNATQHLPPVAPPAPAPHPGQAAPGPVQPASDNAGEATTGSPLGPPSYGGSGGAYGGPAGPGAPGGTQGGGTYGGAGGAYGGGTGEYWGAPVPPAPKKKGRGPLLAAVLAAALLAGGAGGGVGYWAADRTSTSTSETVAAPGEAGDRSADSVAGIASKALPSVVTIQINGGTGNQGGGTGTGFVFDKQGHIVTNNHVVAAGDGNAELTVVFSDGEKYEAEIVGRAEGYDVAVIKLSDPGDANLTPLPLGKSGDVAVGDATVAIGAPFGLSGTVTTGIVSALKRPVASSDGEGSAASYMSALQTDASINPGNSGGPLLNDKGAVIGVNSAIQSTGGGRGGSAGSIGLGFAIPIDQAKRVAQTLIETGEPVYPIIGASVNKRGQGKGAEVVEEADDGSDSVVAGGPADKAGLRGGDVITKLNDTPIDSGPTLISEIWTYEPGQKVKLTYERGGNESTTEVTLGKRTGD